MSAESNTEFFPEKPQRFVPGTLVWIAVGLFAAGAAVAWWQFDELSERFAFGGPAVPRLIIAGSAVLIVLTLAGWLVFRSSHSVMLKLGVVAALVSLPFIFRVEHTGDLFSFRVHLRWRTPDRLLSAPELTGAGPESFAPMMSRTDSFAFTQFLGSQRNGSVPGYRLAPDWRPEIVWRTTMGAGWSGFVAAHGLAITQEQRNEEELVTAYEIETGKPVWYHSEKVRHDEELGGIGPRATPTIDGERVYAMGATGILVCLNSADGLLIWKRDVVADVGSDRSTDQQLVMWGRAASPLIVGNTVVVPGGGRKEACVSLIAYDRLTGDEVWRGGDHQISYSSPVLLTLAGVEQIVTIDEAAVSGHDPNNGQRLWTYPRPGSSSGDANTSQPQQIGDRSLLVSKGYGAGAERISVTQDEAGKWTVASDWNNPRVLRTKLTSAVIKDGYAYGLSDGILECVSLDDGQSQWRKGRMGHGQVLRVGDDLIVLSEAGELFRVAADPEQYSPSEPIEALSGICWNTICLYGDQLLVRNNREAACYRIFVRPAGQGINSGFTGPSNEVRVHQGTTITAPLMRNPQPLEAAEENNEPAETPELEEPEENSEPVEESADPKEPADEGTDRF